MENGLKYVFEPQDYGMPLTCVADAAVDSKGNIFAMVGGDQEPICVFDSGAKYLYGFGRGLIRGTHGIFIDRDDYVYIADSDDHVVMKFTSDGQLLMTLGNRGVPSDSGCVNGNFKTIKRGAAPFNVPNKVAVAPNGDIFVTDGYGNARVHRFSKDGELLKSWGEPGFGPGEFHIPHGVAIDECENVYICDRENDRIQIFDMDGNLKKIWVDISRPDGICYAKGLVYVGELGHRMYVDNVFFEPDENSQWSQVRIFDTNGVEQARFGGPEGEVAGNIYAAHGICLDPQGNVYVAEAGWPESEAPLPENLHPALQKFRRI